MVQYLVVQDEATGDILPGLPTPRLIQNGPRSEAYNVDDGALRTDGTPYGGIWYLKDKGFESPDGLYTRVRVIRNPDYQDYP